MKVSHGHSWQTQSGAWIRSDVEVDESDLCWPEEPLSLLERFDALESLCEMLSILERKRLGREVSTERLAALEAKVRPFYR